MKKGYSKEFLKSWRNNILRDAQDRYDFVVVNFRLTNWTTLSTFDRFRNRLSKYLYILRLYVKITTRIILS